MLDSILVALFFLVVTLFLSGVFQTGKKKTMKRSSTFNPIIDNFHTIEEVQKALREAGLEASQLIVGFDYTKSNEWQGQKTFGGKCLHHTSSGKPNPYQQVVEVIGRTLAPFDDDGQIPAYGFGDEKTRDRSVFPLGEGDCNGIEEVLERYNKITPEIQLSGPTSFAPLIRKAIKTVRETQEYHILVIIADGQVGNERETVDAIVEASDCALSIVLVGVGDGPWDRMQDFDDGLPSRRFDNFQFVDFHATMESYKSDAAFALQALMEIPDQYKAIRELHLLKKKQGHVDIVD